MNTEDFRRIAIDTGKGALLAATVAVAQQLINGRQVGGRKVVLFTASR